MKFICDAADKKTWFRIETEAEAEQESKLMDHAVKKHFLIEQEKAASTYKPTSSIFIEQNIGLNAHIQREMAIFLTLRDAEGGGLATARSDGVSTITASAGQATGTASLTVQQQVASVSVSPTSASLMPTETQQFTATVNDANGNAVSEATVAWSTADPAVATVAANGLLTAMADGQTIVIATSGSQADTATVTVVTVPPPNQAPSTSISAPGNGSSSTQGQTVNFAGSATDPEDGALSGASLVWQSSIDNQIGTGTSVGTSSLSVGTHTIRLIATDSQGAADTASISVTVNPPANQAPSASISAPANGSSFTLGQTVNFSGSATDPEDGPLGGSSLVWRSSINGQIGTGETFGTSALSVGTHTIRLIATDSQGAADTASISVTINPGANQAPSASISAPADGSSSTRFQTVNFAGSATDPEDGPLTGASLVWTSSIDNQIGTGTSFGISTLLVGTHTIRLIATDSQGAADTATISITVNPASNQAPNATLQTPGDGSEFSQGETVTFRGVATDPEDGPLTGGSLVWRSSIEGQIGTGGTFSLSILSVGTHTIRLIATDSQSRADTAIATVTVVTIPGGAYDVDIRYLAGTNPTASQQTAFNNAVARWEQLVLGDLPNVFVNRAAGSWCGSGSPAINETVDDLLILVILEPIDGQGGILGSAGPCIIRGSNLSVVGRMRFDTADLASLEAAGQLEAVILHEMGHVIGIGSLWGQFPGLRVGTGGPDPYFTGTRTRGAFENIGGFSYTGGNKVPVANTGSSGTRDVHWRESVFDDELHHEAGDGLWVGGRQLS